MAIKIKDIRSQIIHYESIDSTNLEAHRYIEKNSVSNPTWLIAEQQTSGRGRMGSSWVSTKGNLFATLIYPIVWDLKILPMLSCLVALAIHETISFYINSTNKIEIKWPNDILVNNAKISGVLIENVLSGKKKYSIIGIGINVVSSPQLADYETSYINQYLNDKTDLSKVFLNLKNSLEDKLNNYSEIKIDDIRLEMLSKSWKFNEKIEFISNSLSGSGIFEGISDNYEILIRTDTDQIKLNSGELKLIRK